MNKIRFQWYSHWYLRALSNAIERHDLNFAGARSINQHNYLLLHILYVLTLKIVIDYFLL